MECIIDTSSFIFAIKNRCDILSNLKFEYPKVEVAISEGIMEELEGISSERGKYGIFAKTIIEMLKNKNIKVYNNKDYVDDWILDHSIQNKESGINQLVITNDTRLYKKLKGNGINVKKVSINCRLR